MTGAMTKSMQDSVETSEEERQRLVKKALGEHLRQAREGRDMTLDKVSENLRIRKAYLQGLESGDWSALPEEVYVMGFLRQYATFIGADIHTYLEDLKPAEYRLTKPFTIPDPPIAMNRGWAIAAGACFLLLFVLFNAVDDGEEPLPRQAADIQQSPAPPAPPPSENQPPANQPSSNPPPAEQPSAGQAADAGEPEPASAPAMRETPAAADMPAAETTQALQHAPPSSGSAGPVTDGRHRYRLSAVGEDVWLQLHAADGELIKEALLRAGETLNLESAGAEILLTCGNSPALRIEIDGALVFDAGQLGEKGKVLHDFHLSAASARNTSH